MSAPIENCVANHIWAWHALFLATNSFNPSRFSSALARGTTGNTVEESVRREVQDNKVRVRLPKLVAYLEIDDFNNGSR